MSTPTLRCAIVAILALPLPGQFLEAERLALPRAPGELKDVFVADLDQDGVLDIAFSDGRRPPLQPYGVLLGDGRGRWLPTAQLLGPVLGLGDADGDGDLDLYLPREIGINTNGVFTARTSSVGIPERAVVADFDGNGIAEVYALGAGSRGVAFDADGDGDLDVCATASGGPLLLLNQGGTLGPASGTLPINTVPVTVAAGDVDGDGDADLVFGSVGQPAELLHNLGNGTFSNVSARLPAVADVLAIAIGDVDGDGDADLVLGETAGGQLLRNVGGRFIAVPGAFDARARHTAALALADMDGDGDLDLVQGCVSQGPPIQLYSVGNGVDARLLWNDGSGTFRDGMRQDLPNASPSGSGSGDAAAVADMDGDDIPDVVVAGFTNAVLRNDGHARFSSVPQPFPATGLRPVLGDLDGDGDVDCVVHSAQALWSLENDGSGNLRAWQGPFAFTDRIADAELGDLDGDGVLDLFVALSGPGTGPFNPSTPVLDQVWIGQGNGGFAVSPGGFATATTPSDIALVDVDGDGDLDALDPHYVQINRGGGFVHAAINNPFPGAQRLATGDLDGDGDVDAAFGARCTICGGGFNDPANGILVNDGTGTFTALAWPATDFSGTWSVAVGDTDGDGDLDVLFGNGSIDDHQDLLVVNLGGGQWDFTSGRVPDEQEDTRQVLLADFDRDGDLDYIAFNAPRDPGGSRRTRIYLNQSRQLAAPLPALLGRGYDLELRGAPLGGAVWVSLQSANVPTPGGVLGLGPLGLGPLAVLPAPTSGTTARLSFSLPADPAVSGLTLYLQAVDLASRRLSNTLEETLVAW